MNQTPKPQSLASAASSASSLLTRRQRWPGRSLLGFLAVLLTLAMFASACGSDQSDSASGDSSGSDSASEETDRFFDESDDAGSVDTSGDAESDFADDEPADFDAEAPEEAMEEEAMEEDGAEAARGQSDVDDGFFAEPAAESKETLDVTTRDNGIRGFVETTDDPESTFALDVDTGAYTVGKRYLEQGQLPPADSVRVEEYVNSFDYDYDSPDNDGLGLTVDGGPSPFDDDNYLVRVGVQAERVRDNDRPDAHLTFVVDTSGSMDRPDRLGLVKESLILLVEELESSDTVAIVTYSDESGVVLEPTRVRNRDDIIDAIDNMQPGGSTNLEAGLRTGYGMANEVFERGDINRVILASDGIANVGATDPDSLAATIRDDADRGIQLVTVGYGMQGFNDVTMEQLADQGDGFYAYVDTIDEAERLFEDELTSTLLTVALDAKIQVVFDEDTVDEYRLIGFENRGVRDSDFRNDDVDAGDLGAGHQVTAIYEINFVRGIDIDDVRESIGEVHLRWEDPNDGDVIEIDENIQIRDLEESWGDTDETFRLATVVTSFAELLRESPYADDVSFDQVLAEAEALADDMRGEDIDVLVELIDAAADLS